MRELEGRDILKEQIGMRWEEDIKAKSHSCKKTTKQSKAALNEIIQLDKQYSGVDVIKLFLEEI